MTNNDRIDFIGNLIEAADLGVKKIRKYKAEPYCAGYAEGIKILLSAVRLIEEEIKNLEQG